MKVLQLIDALSVGGAEGVAVNFANALSRKVEKSYVCVTRAEGPLKAKLNKDVSFHFLKKTQSLDVRALLRFRKLIKSEGIEVVHAHSTSFFFATLLKIIYPKFRLIWHSHLGSRVDTTKQTNKVLVWCSRYFYHIVTVNKELSIWCSQNLKCKSVSYLPNFVDVERFKRSQLHEKTIICVANLKEPKNHINLLEAFKEVVRTNSDWRLELVGRDFQDSYSLAMKDFIKINALEDKIKLHGVVNNVENLLSKSAIGVLSSDSEGLPLSLLEYGAAGLAVVTTKAGFCEEVILNHGKTVAIKNASALARALQMYIDSEESRVQDAEAFHKHVQQNYSVNAVIPLLLEIYKD